MVGCTRLSRSFFRNVARTKADQNQGPDAVERSIDVGIRPLSGVGRIVEAGCCGEHRPTGNEGIIGGKLTLGDPVENDMGDFLGEVIDVCPDDVPCLASEFPVRREQLRVVTRICSFQGEQKIEPAPQTLRGRPILVRYCGKRRRLFGQPVPGNGIVERRFAREVPVDAAMAHTKGTGNIDNGRFGRSEAAEYLRRCFENQLDIQAAVTLDLVLSPGCATRCAFA